MNAHRETSVSPDRRLRPIAPGWSANWMSGLWRPFRRLFRSGASADFPTDLESVKTLYVYEGETTLAAVGDIHGRADLLACLFDRLDQLADQGIGPLQEIYLGDYIDRGPASRDVIDLLIQRSRRKPDTVFLKGNHEQMLMRGLKDDVAFGAWLANGGRTTMSSYGVSCSNIKEPEEPRMALLAAMPQDHYAFLAALDLSYAAGGFFFAHAGIRPGVALDKQTEDDLLWIREPFLSSTAPLESVVVHGHTPDKQPVFRAHRIGIDTGAFHTSVLTCLLVRSSGLEILQTV